MSKSSKNHRHRLITGLSLVSLEGKLGELIGEVKGDDPLSPAVILVGSNVLRTYLRRKLGKEMGAHINLNFPLIIDLASALSEPIRRKKGGSSAPYGGAELLAAEVAQKKAGYFSNIKEKEGLHRSLLGTFTDLREGGIDKLAPLVRELSGELRPASERKLNSLAGLYEAYRRRFEELGYMDSAGIFGYAIRGAGSFSAVFGGCEQLIVYNLYDLNFIQYQLFSALSRHISLTFLLFYDETPPFKYCQPMVSFCEELGCERTIVAEDEDRPQDHLSRLRGYLFYDGRIPAGEVSAEDPTLSILSCPNAQAEAEEIARKMLAFADADVPFYEMAVLVRGSDYPRILRRVFERVDIPYHLAGGEIFADTRLGRSLQLLLSAWGEGLTRQQVMDFITFAPLPKKHFKKEAPNTSLWATFAGEALVVEGMDDWKERLQGLEERYQAGLRRKREEEDELAVDEEVVAQISLMRRFLGKFLPRIAEVPDDKSWGKLVETFNDLAREFLEDDHSASIKLEDILSYISNLCKLEEISPRVDFPRFKAIVSEILSEYRNPIGHFQRCGVNILNLMSARGARFKVVFVPGMVEGLFPARPGKDPILMDGERSAINRYLAETGRGGELPLKGRRVEEERLLFRIAVEGAGERLVLTYPRLGVGGDRARVPSYFLLAAGQALSGELVFYDELEKLPVVNRTPLMARLLDAQEEALDEGEYDTSNILAYLEDRNEAHFAYLLRRGEDRFGYLVPALTSEGERRRNTFGRYDAVILDPQAKEALREMLGPPQGPYSPSRLEDYATCPYKYYLARVMELKPVPEPERPVEISALDLGKLYHRILEKFMAWMMEESRLPMSTAEMGLYRQKMLEVAQAHFAEVEGLGLTGYPLVWELETEFIREDLIAFLARECSQERERGFIPVRVELSFGGDEEGEERVELDIGEGRTVYLRGRIDRLDELSGEDQGFQVTDYKSGKKVGIKKGEFIVKGGLKLQLPLYVIAAGKLLDMPLEKGQSRFLYVNRRRKIPKDGEEVMEGRTVLENREILCKTVAGIIQGMEEGIFFPWPDFSAYSYCSYCNFSSICPGEYRRSIERKRDDPGVVGFARMREVE